MPQLTDIEDIIAQRDLELNDGRIVSVLIGPPRKFGEDGEDYYCPYKIVGIGNQRVRYAGGG